MLETVVLTIIGDDRPGLVDVLSGCISTHGGNWEESRMSHLANKFAGLVLVKVPTTSTDALLTALAQLEADGTMQVTATRSGQPLSSRTRTVELELTGQDHPGIVHDIAHVLAEHGVNIDDFHSETKAASMSGEILFLAHARLEVPIAANENTLRDALESLADELMVDLALGEPD